MVYDESIKNAQLLRSASSPFIACGDGDKSTHCIIPDLFMALHILADAWASNIPAYLTSSFLRGTDASTYDHRHYLSSTNEEHAGEELPVLKQKQHVSL